MARNPKISIEIDARDDASDKIEKVAKNVDKLDGEQAEVEARADDQASDELADIRDKLERLDSDEAKVLLRAETKDARADLRAAQRDLIELDDEEAEVEVKAEIAKAKARLGAISDEMDDLDAMVAEPKIDVPDAGEAGEDAGEAFNLDAVSAIAGGAIASAVVATFNEGTDRIQVRERVAQKFGLLKEDAERLSKEAADIYAGGWGDSTADIVASLALIDQKLVQTGIIAEDKTDDMAEGALVVADVFGKDVTEVIDAVGKLLLNGLAPDAESALDLVATAMQSGADGAGDLFDSVSEYAQQFAALGLSGEDMMGLFITGLENGQRDTDKMADSILEFRLRMSATGDEVEGVYSDLGLSADDYRQAILAGGDSAKTAFMDIIDALDSVEDPTEQNRLAILAMGTQYEEMGPKALEILQSIGTGFETTTGKVDEMNEAMSATQSEWEVLSRDIKEGAGELAEGFAGIANEAKNWMGVINPATAATDGFNVINKELTGSIADAVPVVEDFGKSVDKNTLSLDAVAGASDDATDASQDHEQAIEDETEALEENAEALQDAADELNERNDALMAAADATFALNDAEDDFADTLETSNETLQENSGDLRAVRQAMDAAAESASSLAQAKVRVAEETAAANGQTLTATQRLDIMNGSMLDSAASASGPLRQSIIDYIASVNGIPASTMTDIQAAIDRGDIAEAERLLNGASRSRTSAVTADANTYQANRDLDYAARDRTSTITVNSRTGSRNGGNSFFAKGTGGAPPGMAVVGEQGPELVELSRGDKVHTAEKTKRMTKGGNNQPTVVNNYFPPGTRPDDVARATRRYADVQGPL